MSSNSVLPVVDLDLTELAFDEYCLLKLNETKPEMRIVFVLGAMRNSIPLSTNDVHNEAVTGKATVKKRKRAVTKAKGSKLATASATGKVERKTVRL